MHGFDPQAHSPRSQRLWFSFKLSIPLLGYPVPKGQEAKVKEDLERLEKLVEEHDALFLLVDTRESRWLPTVLGAVKSKIAINAALGFDTFLVMQCGVRAKEVKEGSQRLGCYYCNDTVAHGNSLTDRTLDHDCGRALDVSFNISMTLTASRTRSTSNRNGYDRYTGCSESVLEAYVKEGFGMLLKVFSDQEYLETLAGLDKLADEGEAALEAVEWDEDGDDGDDF
ncbi:hypothetical protein NMY22_g17945 [Coprinellus aureogranulatus]|nr:hypothetical protein NMY22_g17945 [Coprinellus aureogranulatus]